MGLYLFILVYISNIAYWKTRFRILISHEHSLYHYIRRCLSFLSTCLHYTKKDDPKYLYPPPQFKQYPTISDRINHTFTFCIYIKPCVSSAIGFEKGTHNLNCSSRVLPCGVYLHVMNFTMFYRPFMCVPKFRVSPWAHAY